MGVSTIKHTMYYNTVLGDMIEDWEKKIIECLSRKI